MDKVGETEDLSGKRLNSQTTVSDKFGFYCSEIVVGSGYSNEQNYEYMSANIELHLKSKRKSIIVLGLFSLGHNSTRRFCHRVAVR